jgi:hypothetical protein
VTTDLNRRTPGNDTPLIVFDEAHEALRDADTIKLIADLCRRGRKTGVNIDFGDDDIRQLVAGAYAAMQYRQAALVEAPTGPSKPPTSPKPTREQTVNTIGALTVLAGAITGLATHNSPDLVGYPIAATLAAAGIGAVVLYRSPRQVTS